MPIYQNCIIYKLKHNEDYDDINIYVGSTTNFRLRKNCHKSSCNNEKNRDYNFPVYQYIRDNDGWDNWVMIPIEEYPCNSKNELVIRERHHIDLLRPTLNIVKPGRTIEEWTKDNKKQLVEKNKEYREQNKEKIKEKKKEYREQNKEKLAEINKKWAETNKEKLTEYKKQYYEENKDQINKKRVEKVICDHCGCDFTKNNLKRHQQTNKCINFVKT